MRVWITLYAMIWIVLAEFLLAMTRNAPDWVIWVHVALGIAIAGLAFVNFRGVRDSAVAGRVKRTSKSTMQLSIAMAVLGALLVFDVGRGFTLLFGVTIYGIVLFLHVFIAFAIITQAAAVAIAFDMWEEKEFAEVTTPGDVPAMPTAPGRPEPGAGGRRPH